MEVRSTVKDLSFSEPPSETQDASVSRSPSIKATDMSFVNLRSVLIFENLPIFIKFGNYRFTSVLIDGQFPNYKRVIPASQTNHFEVNKADLADALKRVALLVEKKSNKVYFTLSDGNLMITSQESEIGIAKEEIPCRYVGDDITIAFNYVYIEEPMKVINTEYLHFDFTESMKAVTLKSEPESDYFHIIMPMQLES